jgi:hypothetical protein
LQNLIAGASLKGQMRSEDNSDQSTGPGETPARPWGTPAGPAAEGPPAFEPAGRRKLPLLSILFFVLMLALVGSRAYQELSTPQAWAYWKDSYFSPSLTASVVQPAALGAASRPVLAISGTIGPAAATWFRTQLHDAKLRSGDTVAFSSPGGRVDQAIIIGEVLRSRGLKSAVATFDADGRMRPSYCASACVLAYAGGTVRIGVPGSALGVHRFTSETPGSDAVAETQRTAGMILGYMTRMGVASSVMEAMSATDAIRWLTPQQAVEMKLVTDPLAQR